MRKFAQYREYLPHAGVVAAIVLFAVLFGLHEGSQKGSNKAEGDRWHLPNIPVHVTVKPEEPATVAGLFYDEVGAAKAKAPVAVVDQKWHFVGTTRTGNSISAVVVLPKKMGVLRLGQGAKLPNGEEIVAVDNGVMRYTDESGQHELRAFTPPPVPKKEDK